jgi:hypothetical protein
VQYGYFVDRQNPEFKAPWNQIRNIPRVFTPDDKAIQTPNSDTPYSFAGLPLVNAFWSLTMYEQPQSLLVANPINRYLVSSPMLPQFQRDADGGLTLIIQKNPRGRTRKLTGCQRPPGHSQ